MIVPSTPDASRPGPSGPDRFSPTGGSCRRAVRASADTLLSCHSISSLTGSGRSGAASPTAFAAYAAAPRACAPMCTTAAACPAALAAAAAAGLPASRAEPPPTNRRRISSATSSSPRLKARVRAIASRGRVSAGASASNSPSTRSAQSAAHTATIRRSASLSVCGEPTLRTLSGVCDLSAAIRVSGRVEPAHNHRVVRRPRPPYVAGPSGDGVSMAGRIGGENVRDGARAVWLRRDQPAQLGQPWQ